MSGRPVPWASWDEWQTLRDDLWSIDPARQESGLQQVSAWRLRGKLPLGVDTTAHLMDARRADEEWQRAVDWANTTAAAATAKLATTSAASAPSTAAAAAATAADAVADAAVAAGELPLRLRYSLPLIRLVNGISDSQQRGRVAASVAVLSDAAGLPRALVDVRHEATHNELPSLPLLRAAADSALAWLRECYWDAQSRALALAAQRIGALLAGLADSWRAAMAAAMSRAGALGAAEEVEADNDEEEPEGAGTSSGYSGPQGQRLRRQTMSELRALVPPAFTHELLQPVLDCPVLLPPELPWQQQGQPPEQGQQHQVEDAAWRAAMKHLLKWYPRLKTLLIQAALRRLVATVSSSQASQAPAPPSPAATNPKGALAGANLNEGATEGSLQRAQACVRWVLRLLPAGSMQQPTQGCLQAVRNDSPARRHTKKATAAAASGGSVDGGFGGGAVAFLDGPLAVAQLEALLSIAVAGLGAQEGGDGCGSSLGGGGGGDGLATAATECQAPIPGGTAQTLMAVDTGSAVPISTERSRPGQRDGMAKAGAELRQACGEGPEAGRLQEVVAALRRALALATGEGRGSKRRRLGAHAGGEGPRRPGGSRGPDGAGDGDVWAVEGLRATAGQAGAQADGAVEGNGEGEEEEPQPAIEEQLRGREQQQHGSVRRRWQRCEAWGRCAIGCLPCPLNPNGRFPMLVPRPPPLPSTDLDGAAARTVADAAGNAAGVPWGPLQEVRQQQQQPESSDVEYYVEPEEGKGAGDVSREEEGGGDGMPDDEEEQVEEEEEEEEEGALGDEAEVAGGGGTGGGGLFGVLLQQHGAGHEGLGGGVGFLL